MGRKCGECLMDRVEIVELLPDGKCPACGTDYGPERGEGQHCESEDRTQCRCEADLPDREVK